MSLLFTFDKNYIYTELTCVKHKNVCKIKITEFTGTIITVPLRTVPGFNHAGIVLGLLCVDDDGDYLSVYKNATIVCSLKNKINEYTGAPRSYFHIEPVVNFSRGDPYKLHRYGELAQSRKETCLSLIQYYLNQNRVYNIFTNNCQTFVHQVYFNSPSPFSETGMSFFLLCFIACNLFIMHIMKIISV